MISKMMGFWKGNCLKKYDQFLVSTLPETNIAPEDGWLEDTFPFGKPIFRGYVSFRECMLNFGMYTLGCKPHQEMPSSPPGWHSIFRLGNPNLSLHLLQLLEAGASQYIHPYSINIHMEYQNVYLAKEVSIFEGAYHISPLYVKLP